MAISIAAASANAALAADGLKADFQGLGYLDANAKPAGSYAMGVSADGNYIAGRIMNADGTYPGGYFTIAEAPGRQLRPPVVWNGETFVVAWDDQRNQTSFFDDRTDVYGTRVSETGTVLDPAGFATVTGPQGDASPAMLSPASGVCIVAGTRFMVTPPMNSYRIGITRIGVAAAPRDVTGDGTMNIDDLLAVINAWGNCPKPPVACSADVTGDGAVNIDDLLAVINGWT